MNTLQLVLLLLSASVLVVAAFRSLGLPPILGYLLVGVVVGPRALDLLPDADGARALAEFGVVFLMFSIGLEFSLPRLFAMKRIVFGLGTAQVAVTLAAVALVASSTAGVSWSAGIALGGALAMSSTAILSRLLADRRELGARHGREVMGVLLFQDLAVVPLLVLIPALSQPMGAMAGALALAFVKAAALLTLVLVFGQRLMRGWFALVARKKSGELFMLNVLLITLSLAWVTELAGLSLALGAFIAGMLISETEYRYAVEEDIKPFRDVLMGLFFISIGMMLDIPVILREWTIVAGVLAALLAGKLFLAWCASRLLGAPPGTALRTGLWLCAGGEFGFVLLAQGERMGLLAGGPLQPVLAALVLSMMAAPLIVHFSDRIVLRLVASEWLTRSMQLTQIAARSIAADKHALLCGYGRTGQHLARFLERENISFTALDLDPERVREAAGTRDSVSYGDCTRRETLLAAGIARASVVVVTFADLQAALRLLARVRALRPDVPVVVRTREQADAGELLAAGAAEVVPEALESSVMLATHALAFVGVPPDRFMDHVRELREQRRDATRREK
ncbi:MAG: monovalent cation:proton antiporter-2 (CPA2) family protein [Candidatus Nitricoxidivorans perseverans]|uniref:Monovalent cation:proton antiporter-2 (CPA2) family protein n=1 Tax=Candidatus Nitricoxidivorans perseverans TaxID=2975601 RepID=A0AA49FJR9_9PROT|nr:MAG: monovalent cation:proton antiporter-2 (CPA2) family protein [Candidatus Nitricoxidivorans perseverans]